MTIKLKVKNNHLNPSPQGVKEHAVEDVLLTVTVIGTDVVTFVGK